MRKLLVIGFSGVLLGAILLVALAQAQQVPMHDAQMQHGQPTGGHTVRRRVPPYLERLHRP